jgi:hypothetical protein
MTVFIDSLILLYYSPATLSYWRAFPAGAAATE